MLANISTGFAYCFITAPRPTEVWPTPGLVHYIIQFWGLLLPNDVLPGAKFTLHPSLAFSYIGSVTAPHLSGKHLSNFAVW